MGSQALEQILRSAPMMNEAQSKMNQTIDSYANNTTAMYSLNVGPIPMMQMDIKPISTPYIRPLEPLKEIDTSILIEKTPIIKPSYRGVVMPHPKILGIPDLHDTYKVDRFDNLYKGHTTINLPGDKKIRMDHGYWG